MLNEFLLTIGRSKAKSIINFEEEKAVFIYVTS